jgi:hypothetical protein
MFNDMFYKENPLPAAQNPLNVSARISADSKLRRVNIYPDKGFNGFPQALQTNAGKRNLNTPQQLPIRRLPIRNS